MVLLLGSIRIHGGETVAENVLKQIAKGGQHMANTLPPEKWGLSESADWWSAGQAARQQTLGAATEMMLDLAGVRSGNRVLDIAAGTGDSTLMAARRVGPMGTFLLRIFPLAC